MTGVAEIDVADGARAATHRSTSRRPRLPRRLVEAAPPVLVGIASLAAWEWAVQASGIPPYIVPAPTAVVASFAADWQSLLLSLWFTAKITIAAFAMAVIGGVALGIVFTLSRAVERTLWPYAVALQVTPVVSIAPLVIIWVGYERLWLALLILSWLVAFFPMLANTVLGLRSADRGLINLMRLYKTSRWQLLWHVRLPAALPYMLAGVRISSGLALIGAVVAEFVAGSGSATGIAWRIVESGNMLDIPRTFACIFLLCGFGLLIWQAASWVQWALLHRWHESELKEEGA